MHDSLGDFYLAQFPTYRYVPFQQEKLIPALELVNQGRISRLAIFIPSGHAKTDIVTKTFIPWYLGRNPGKNAILMAHTDPLAREFGDYVRDAVSNSRAFRLAFPHVRLAGSNRAKGYFRTNQGNAFYAFGMTGAVTGRRGDLLVIDDPVRNLEDAESDAVQTNLYNVYRAVLKDRMRPGSAIVLAMTRWAVRDFAARVLEEEGARWQVLALRAQETPDGPYLWEDFYGRGRYEEAKEDSYIWEAKWQQMPRPRAIQGFQREWLRFYLSEHAEPEYAQAPDGTPVLVGSPISPGRLFSFPAYIFCDPALGKGRTHDRTCIWVLAAGPGRRLFWVDGVLDRLDPGERIAHLCRLTALWHPRLVVYEEYGYHSDSYFLNLRLKDEGLQDVPVLAVGRKAIKGLVGGRLRKEERIIQLVSDFRDGRIWIPKRMMRTLIDGSRLDLVEHFITREYLPWAGENSVPHDDMLDSLARIHDPEVVIEHYAEAIVPQSEDFVESEPSFGGGSWESRF